MNANNTQTLSGITPAQSHEVHYVENTSRAETFLQKKFDLVIEKMNQDAREWNAKNPDKDPRPMQDPVEVNLITTRMSSKFYPFLLVLPSTVLKDRNYKNNRNELDIFNPQHSERSANMKDPLYKVIEPFLYDDNERNAFFSQTMQHELKISSRSAAKLKGNTRLKVYSFDKGRVNYVAVILDPLRLFKNMATLVSGDTPFVIYIDKVEQVKGGNYRYHFSKCHKTGKGKNKKNVDFANQILQAMTDRR